MQTHIEATLLVQWLYALNRGSKELDGVNGDARDHHVCVLMKHLSVGKTWSAFI
jgi:hypothetical protein